MRWRVKPGMAPISIYSELSIASTGAPSWGSATWATCRRWRTDRLWSLRYARSG